MSDPTLATVKRLFSLSNNQCAFPNCIAPLVSAEGIVLGEICHIRAKSAQGPRFDEEQTEAERNSFENLILLCSPHHKIIDRRPSEYTVEVLENMKSLHESKSKLVSGSSPESELFARIILNSYRNIDIPNNSGTVIIDSPGAIKADKVTIKTEGKNVKMLPPNNSIASDLKLRGYVKYLIDRYKEFAGSDKHRKYKFHYGIIYNSIKKEFGVKWDHVPIESFNYLVEFLHKKIDRTRLQG